MLMGIAPLASFTGYSLPSEAPIREHPLERFRVLHCYAFPTLTVGLNLCWLWIARPHRRATSGIKPDRSMDGRNMG